MPRVPILTTEQIQERMIALNIQRKYPSKAEVIKRLEELAITNPPKRPKNVVWR
jgi:hypothetical protein